MTNYTGLPLLAKLIRRFEPDLQDATLTILAHEQGDQVTQLLLPSLQAGDNAAKITVEKSTGEYSNHLAVLRVGANKYTIAKDYVETYLSEINSYACRITGEALGLLVYHNDYPGVVRDVSQILADYQINISKLNVSREQKGKTALLVSLTDEDIPVEAIASIEQLPNVTKVISLSPPQ